MGFYASYNIVCAKALENTSGSTGSGGDGEKTLTKAKADVVESEWKAKTEKDIGLHATYEKIKADLKGRICRLSKSISVSLQLCVDPNKVVGPEDVGASFIVSCDLDPCDC